MGILGRLNGIVKFIENPCNEPWSVYVEAAVPWANKAAMALLSIDTLQTVRTSLNPGSLRSKRHMRRGYNAEHEGTKRVPGIPDPYEYLGHLLNKPIKQFIEANATWGTKAIFLGVGIVESAIWQYMLIDVATEFLYHSLADARKSKYCQRWYKGDGLRSGPIIAQAPGQWRDVNVPLLKYQRSPVTMNFTGAFCSPVGHGQLTLVASFSGIAIYGSGTQLVGFRIINAHTGEVLALDPIRPVFTGEPVEVVLSAEADSSVTLAFQFYQELGEVYGEGILMAWACGDFI